MAAKTYNRRDSQMVTHSSTSRPVQCLCMAERTGCPVFTDLWSYVLDDNIFDLMLMRDQHHFDHHPTCDPRRRPMVLTTDRPFTVQQCLYRGDSTFDSTVYPL
jgi:hypothetical protein